MKKPAMIAAAAALTIAMVGLPALAANAVLVTLGAHTCVSSYAPKLGASAYSTGQTAFTFYKTPSNNYTTSAAGTSTFTWKTRNSPFNSVSYTGISSSSLTKANYQCVD